LTKYNIMKLTKYLFIVAIFGSTLFISCTPENVEDGQTEQQIDRPDVPRQG
ncbi:MAG: hypothetical protein ACI9EK_000051, partial [Psychroserpens sp.]